MRQRSVLLGNEQPQRKKKRKNKTSPDNKNLIEPPPQLQLQETANSNNYEYELNSHIHYTAVTVVCDDTPKPEQCEATLGGEGFSFEELRQRSVNGGFEDFISAVSVVDGEEGSSVEIENQRKESSARSEAVESLELELKRVLAEDSNLEKSPVTYFLEQVYNGNSLRSTTTLGNEKGRERVYDAIFRLPWRCELVFAYRCWLLCLLQFISVIIDYHANKDHDDYLEASESKEVQEDVYN